MEQNPEITENTLELAQQLLAHSRAHRLMEDLHDMGVIAACACALNRAYGLAYSDVEHFALINRFFGAPDGQFWDRRRAYALCVNDEVMDMEGTVGWEDILAKQPVIEAEKPKDASEPLNRAWLSEPIQRTAGVLACRDLGSRSEPMLELAAELYSVAEAWRMKHNTQAAESAPKPKRM